MQKMTTLVIVFVCISMATATHADTPYIGAIEKNEDIRDRVYSSANENIWASEALLVTNVDIENGSSIKAYAPRIRITGNSHIERGSTFRAGVPVFKVHFVNMVDHANANTKPPNLVVPGGGTDFAADSPPMSQAEFEEFCQNEIAILNYYFKSDDGRQLVKFEMKDVDMWDVNMLTTSYYQCTSTGNDENDNCPAGVTDHLEAFNAEDFKPYRDDDAINIIYFDNPYKQRSGANHNLDSNGPPMILIDYQRVDGNLGHDCDADGLIDDCGLHFSGLVQAGSHDNGIQDDDHDRSGVEPHEMGHIFGLYHTCRDHPYDPTDPDFELWDNIMWGSVLKDTPEGFDTCCEDVVPKPTCQDWLRSSYFSKAPISKVDGEYRYIQSYYETPRLYYENDFWTYGQAEIIMHMAYHFREMWDLE